MLQIIQSLEEYFKEEYDVNDLSFFLEFVYKLKKVSRRSSNHKKNLSCASSTESKSPVFQAGKARRIVTWSVRTRVNS